MTKMFEDTYTILSFIGLIAIIGLTAEAARWMFNRVHKTVFAKLLLLKSTAPEHRRKTVARELERTEDRRVLPALLERLCDTSIAVRVSCLSSAVHIMNRRDVADREILLAVLRAHFSSIHEMKTHPDRFNLLDSIQRSLQELIRCIKSDEELKAIAIQNLEGFLDGDCDVALQKFAIARLVELREADAVLEFLNNTAVPHVRHAAIQIIGREKYVPALPFVLAMVGDANAGVAEISIEVAKTLGAGDEELFKLIEQALRVSKAPQQALIAALCEMKGLGHHRLRALLRYGVSAVHSPTIAYVLRSVVDLSRDHPGVLRESTEDAAGALERGLRVLASAKPERKFETVVPANYSLAGDEDPEVGYRQPLWDRRAVVETRCSMEARRRHEELEIRVRELITSLEVPQCPS